MKDKYLAALLAVFYVVLAGVYLSRENELTQESLGVVIAGCGIFCMIHLHELYKIKQKEEEEDSEDYPNSVEVQESCILSWTGPREELLKLITEFKEAGWEVCPEFSKCGDNICYLEEGIYTTSMQKDMVYIPSSR